MALRGLIFDVDGTLAETEEAHRTAFNAAFAANGLDWHWDVPLYRELLRVAGGKERISHYIETHARDFPADAVAALHADKTRRYQPLIADGSVPLRPGVAHLIAEARAAGLKLGIATTTSRVNILGLLVANLGPGGPALFDAIAAGEDAESKKPHPAVYRHALAGMGIVAPDCLAIEDSIVGLRSATGAGIATVITRSDYCLDEDYPGALAVFEDLAAVTLADLAALHARAAAPA